MRPEFDRLPEKPPAKICLSERFSTISTTLVESTKRHIRTGIQAPVLGCSLSSAACIYGFDQGNLIIGFGGMGMAGIFAWIAHSRYRSEINHLKLNLLQLTVNIAKQKAQILELKVIREDLETTLFAQKWQFTKQNDHVAQIMDRQFEEFASLHEENQRLRQIAFGRVKESKQVPTPEDIKGNISLN